MARPTKVQDWAEVQRWFDEGRAYSWMQEQYLEKYHIETSKSMWSTLRRTIGAEPRLTRDTDLLPWRVKEEHRFNSIPDLLRFEARVREGKRLVSSEARRLKLFRERLDRENRVVHYDPDTEQGWWLLPRKESDDDIVRKPAKATTRAWYKEG